MLSHFANQRAFDAPDSKARATGADLNLNHAIVDSRGQILAYARTGGMLSPQRCQLGRGDVIFRFGAAGRPARTVASGAWWVQKAEFEKLLSFAQAHDVGVGVAVRILCLVPPEWSDLGVLIRARVLKDLLAWRGLANTVVTPAKGGGPVVRLPHQNEIAARRLHQLFIPGLEALGMASSVVQVENDYPLDAAASLHGFLYL